jgi:predicted dehydrogenase
MERRMFLAGAGVALHALGANEKVNVAVEGLGGRGRHLVARWLQNPNANVVALCDVDTAQTERVAQMVEKATGRKPKLYHDPRKLHEDKEVDAVCTATPNHWHALSAIWAMQAGKDVYGEKPASYNMFESRQLVATARKHKRICQTGMQSRSSTHVRRAVELLRGGALGRLYMAKGLCFKRRVSIGRTPQAPVPPGLDWDIFLGPAPMRPYTKNRHTYNWHWFWDTGNGDIGNQGIHEMDIARWGMGVGLPTSVVSTGGKYIYDDDQETPNTQYATLDYGDKQIVFEVRGLITHGEADMRPAGRNYVGNLFYGEKGFMRVDDQGFAIFLGEKHEPGEAMAPDRRENSVDLHIANFVEAVKSRRQTDLRGEVAEGAISADLFHMANVSYRLRRKLAFDPAKGVFVGDAEANAMRTRPKYRAPYVVPEKV